MKLTLVFLILVSFGIAAPKETLNTSEAFRKAVAAELPESPVGKEEIERLLVIRIEMEKLRRTEVSIEMMWSFSRRSTTSKKIVETNRLSTLNELRTLRETSAFLLALVREAVLAPKRKDIEALFTSLVEAVREYEKELQGGRYP